MKTESNFEFKVGDEVEAFGLKGKVIHVDQEFGKYPIIVEYDVNHMRDPFTLDGKLHLFHKEPSLKLINRPKRKVKKKFYQWYRLAENVLVVCSSLMTEDLKYIDGEVSQYVKLYKIGETIFRSDTFIEIEVEE